MEVGREWDCMSILRMRTCEHTLLLVLMVLTTFGGCLLSKQVLPVAGVDNCLHGVWGALASSATPSLPSPPRRMLAPPSSDCCRASMRLCVSSPHHSAWRIVRTEWIVLTKVCEAAVLTHSFLTLELVRVEDDALNE